MIWDPSDANPLHRRLPAEIVSRRTRIAEKKGPTLPKEVLEDIVVDQKTAITLKPDARPKWLSKACRMTQDGKASATELYNIVVSRRFSAGLPERIGRKLGAVVKKNLNLFSDKQRRHLVSTEFHLHAYIAEDAPVDDEDDAHGDVAAPLLAASRRSEATMAPCRAFSIDQADTGETRRREAEEKEAQEADRTTRLVEEAAKRNRREAVQREERKNVLVEEASQLSQKAAQEEAARKRKLEEEADALFERALCPAPAARESDHRSRRNRDRSHSVEAARFDSPPPRRAEWRSSRVTELTGSRAILLNKDFQEDLPHLQRPSQGGMQRGSSSFQQSVPALTNGGGARSRSREPRERSRRRSRRH